jgi:hypothetical protein
MAFTNLTAAQTDADSPLDQTLMDLIRTNFTDLDTRVSAIEAFSDQDIRDDFFGGATTIDTTTWDSGGIGTFQRVAEHQCFINPGGAGYRAIGATTERIRVNLTEEYVVIMEFRIYNSLNDVGATTVGLMDVANTTAGAGVVTDTAFFIGVVANAGGGDWTIRVDDNTGPTDRGGQGTWNVWTTFKFTVTCSAVAGNRKVEVDTDGVSSGAAITTDIPSTVDLYPVAGVNDPGAAGAQLRIDYYHCYFSGRPLAA